ncbi:MAG: toll/interleukin-1 receptor domain-containing protein [Gemmatimonas sp.]
MTSQGEQIVVAGAAPRVFVSHASEDQARFVTRFATDLRLNGVDAWYSRWELGTGDSLVRKLEAGIEGAEVFIVVLSRISVTKPWVKEEIDAGLISAIEQKARFMPIVIEECDVPLFLRSRIYNVMSNPDNYRAQLMKLVAKIFGKDDPEKPPLGAPPAFVVSDSTPIDGLSHIDSLVLRAAYEQIVEADNWLIDLDAVADHPALRDVSDAQILDSFQILEPTELQFEKVLGEGRWGSYYVAQGTVSGFETYARAYIENYGELKKRVAGALLNDGQYDSEEIAQRLAANHATVAHILKYFAAFGYLRLDDTIGRTVGAFNVNAPKLRRAVDHGSL